MGALIDYKVQILRLVEDDVIVFADSEKDALRKAEKLDGVAKALAASSKWKHW